MDRIKDIPVLYELMLKAKKHYFNELKPSQLEENLAVIYSITNFKTNQVLYVGKTTKLRRRLYGNHLMGPITNARLKKYLIDDSEIPQVIDLDSAKQYIKDNCYFHFVYHSF